MKHIFGIKAQIRPLKLGGQKTNLWFAAAKPGQKKKKWQILNQPELPHDCLFWRLLVLFFLNFDGPITVARVDILTRPGGVVDTRLIFRFYAFLFYLRKDQARTYHIRSKAKLHLCHCHCCYPRIWWNWSGLRNTSWFLPTLGNSWQALRHMKNSEDWIRNSNFHSTLTKKGNLMHISKNLTVLWCRSIYLQNCWPSCSVHLTPLTSSNYFLLFPLFSKDTFKPRPQPPQHGSCDDQKPDQRRCFSGKPRSGRQLPRVRVALHGKQIKTAFNSVETRHFALCLHFVWCCLMEAIGNALKWWTNSSFFLSTICKCFSFSLALFGILQSQSCGMAVSDQCLDALNLWNLGSHRYISIQHKKQTYTFSKTFAKFRPGHLKKDLLSRLFLYH